MSLSASTEWIVGFDGSAASRAAARWAVVNARGRVDSIRAVHAWSIASATVYSAFEPVILAERIGSVESAARRELETFAGELADESSVPINATLVQGDSSNVLIEAARESDQLIMGATGAGRFERLLLGSTSTRCATHSPVPTVVIRQERTDAKPLRVRHIVVAVDGSPNSNAAATWACAFAEPDSQVDLIGVWEFSPGIFSDEHYYYPRAVETARQRFEDQIAELPAATRRDDLDINARFLEGTPRRQIAAHADAADLLVVGARGRGGIGAALLGSVSRWLLHHVETPIAVVPHPNP